MKTIRLAFRQGQDGFGEALDILVGLDIDIRLAVIGEAEKIQLDRHVDRGGKQWRGNQPHAVSRHPPRPLAHHSAECQIEWPEHRNHTPWGFVGDDRIGQQRSSRHDGRIAVAGIRGENIPQTGKQTGQCGPFVAGHEINPIPIQRPDQIVGALFMAARFHAGRDPCVEGFIEPAQRAEIPECARIEKNNHQRCHPAGENRIVACPLLPRHRPHRARRHDHLINPKTHRGDCHAADMQHIGFLRQNHPRNSCRHGEQMPPRARLPEAQHAVEEQD